MDKFGFFKLLNSFLTPSTQQSGETDGISNGKNDGKSDLISSLLNSLSEQNFAKDSDFKNAKPLAPQESTPQVNARPLPQPPLQAGMLKTMSSHDDFIKRVKSKNAQTLNGD